MSHYKELAKHSGNYLLATLATKALAFISIPIYTYLLTVEEYGVINVFGSTTGIATVLLTLNTEVAVSRYYFDAKDEEDFKRFVGTSTRLSFSIFTLMSALLILFCKPLAHYLDFEVLLTLSIIPVSLYSVINSVFTQIYQPMLKSRKIAIVSSVQAYLAFALSVVFILLLKDKKYYGSVYGTICAMVILAVYSINQIKAYYIGCWDKKYIKYILNYSLPYLPYSLSGIIIAQFGKLIIGQQQGFESAGLYSFASNLASLMLVVILVGHSAWNPYYFRYMNAKDYKGLDKDYDLIWRLTLVAGIGLSLFGKEIGLLLGRPEYAGGLYLIPILVVGYCFYQWSYVYMRNCGYAKKTIWNAVAVITSGVANVCLNYLLLPIYGDLGVALAFSLSYFLLLIVSYCVNKFILKQYSPRVAYFIIPFIFYAVVVCLNFTFDGIITNIIIAFLFKLFVLLLAGSILMRSYLSYLCHYLKK